MGQMKTSLTAIQKLLVNNPVKLQELKTKADEDSDHIATLNQTADEGWNVIHMYLVAKAQKQKKKLSEMSDVKLKDLMDSELAGLMKGLDDWRKNIKTQMEKAQGNFTQGVAALRANVDSAGAEAKRLRGIADKKKAKWLVSSKYKAKIKGYLEVIDSVEGIIAVQTKTLDKAKGIRYSSDFADKYYTVKPDTTVKQVEELARMDHQSIMNDYLKNQKEADEYVHKWRDEYKSMGVQMQNIKKWMEDADAMEKEG